MIDPAEHRHICARDQPVGYQHSAHDHGAQPGRGDNRVGRARAAGNSCGHAVASGGLGGAGRALHRLLAHAATTWVFASLHTQPLEAAPIRALIRDRLNLPGSPQILLQLGRAHTTHATARRPPVDLTDP